MPFFFLFFDCVRRRRRGREKNQEENVVGKGTVLNRWHAYVQKGDGEKGSSVGEERESTR